MSISPPYICLNLFEQEKIAAVQHLFLVFAESIHVFQREQVKWATEEIYRSLPVPSEHAAVLCIPTVHGILCMLCSDGMIYL